MSAPTGGSASYDDEQAQPPTPAHVAPDRYCIKLDLLAPLYKIGQAYAEAEKLGKLPPAGRDTVVLAQDSTRGPARLTAGDLIEIYEDMKRKESLG